MRVDLRPATGFLVVILSPVTLALGAAAALLPLFSDPGGAAFGGMSLAWAAMVWRVSSLRLRVSDGQITVRNLFRTYRMSNADVVTVSSDDFHGAGRPVPVLTLVAASATTRSRRLKVLASARFRRKEREKVLSTLRVLGPVDSDGEAFARL